MASIEQEIKKIAIEGTKDVILKVTSGIYNDLMLKLNRLENAIESLREHRDLEAEVRKVLDKCKGDNAVFDMISSSSERKRKKRRISSLVEEDKNIKESTLSNKLNKRRKVYYSWNERMAHLLQLKCLRWIEDNVIEISKDAIAEMFPSENSGKSIFQFHRIYGKKGDQTRFDITYKNQTVRLTHRCLNKESILKMYGPGDVSSETEDYISMSAESLENLFET